MSRPATRVLALLELLQSRGFVSGRELAQQLEVDGRTLRRYIGALEELGIPITTERGRYGGYGLVAGFKLPPLMFSNDEALALALGLLSARALGLADAVPATAGALAKIERLLPDDERRQLLMLERSVALDLPQFGARRNDDLLRRIAGAAQSRRRVQVRYVADRGETTERMVDPYALVFRKGHWYVTGHCHLRKGLRSFRLDRVAAAHVLSARFRRPASFDPVRHLRLSIATLPRAIQVRVHLQATVEAAAAELGESLGVLEPMATGVRLHARTDSLDYFARQLARLPFPFSIDEPQALRRALARQARRMLAIGSDDPPARLPQSSERTRP